MMRLGCGEERAGWVAELARAWYTAGTCTDLLITAATEEDTGQPGSGTAGFDQRAGQGQGFVGSLKQCFLVSEVRVDGVL